METRGSALTLCGQGAYYPCVLLCSSQSRCFLHVACYSAWWLATACLSAMGLLKATSTRWKIKQECEARYRKTYLANIEYILKYQCMLGCAVGRQTMHIYIYIASG